MVLFHYFISHFVNLTILFINWSSVLGLTVIELRWANWFTHRYSTICFSGRVEWFPFDTISSTDLKILKWLLEWNYYSLQLLDEETKPVNFTCRLQRKSIEWTLNLALNTKIYILTSIYLTEWSGEFRRLWALAPWFSKFITETVVRSVGPRLDYIFGLALSLKMWDFLQS